MACSAVPVAAVIRITEVLYSVNFRRFLSVAICLMFIFLGVYSWNQRTHTLDSIASSVGLEVLYIVFTPLREIQNKVEYFWRNYVDLLNVQEENRVLRARVEQLEADLLQQGEVRAELLRLRDLLSIPMNEDWKPVAANVLTGRMGPNAVLESVTINRGYLAGAIPGTPLLTRKGLVGRILRSSAHTSTVLLLVDPGCRVAVRGQISRATGILAGRGAQHALEVRFVDRTDGLQTDELLVTSGLDGVYPQGIPVARVISAKATEYSQFMQVHALPLVQTQNLEDVLLMEYKGTLPLSQRVFVEPAESPNSPLIQGPMPAPAP